MNKSTLNLILLLALFCSILKAQTPGGNATGYVTGENGTDTLVGAVISSKHHAKKLSF